MSKDDNKNEGKNLGIGSEIAREGYEASVVHRMTGRAGASTIKGACHREMLWKLWLMIKEI